MGNTGLLRHEAEMTLTNSGIHPFDLLLCSSLNRSRREKAKEPLKNQRVSDPIKISPFVVPTTIKRGSYRKRPYGGNSSQSNTQSFF